MPPDSPTGFAIYGAGNMGRAVAAFLRGQLLPTVGFIDRQAESLAAVSGLACRTLEQSASWAGSATVVLALHNPAVSVAEVRRQLRAVGWTELLTLPEFCRKYGFRPELGYWLDLEFPWSEQRDAIARVRALWADDDSRALFDAALALRQSDDYEALPRPVPEQQYFPADLARWPQPLHLIDGGAFDGDTLRLARQAGYSLGPTLALEPDPANVARLQAYLADCALSQVTVIPAGLSSLDQVARFSLGAGAASHLSRDDEGMAVQLRCVDSLCAELDFVPSLIKLDIEGAELGALEGASQVLARGQTELALAAYHRPDDLWVLPSYLAEKYPGMFRYYLRAHAENGFDTVLYARLVG